MQHSSRFFHKPAFYDRAILVFRQYSFPSPEPENFSHQHTQWLNDLIQVVFHLEHAPALPVLAL
ncbi:MAG: hypothetical protein SPG32_06750 [Candidatus Ventricola sp.]|nr:hypothetical protein [Candidatus Ventricola sp.]